MLLQTVLFLSVSVAAWTVPENFGNGVYEVHLSDSGEYIHTFVANITDKLYVPAAPDVAPLVSKSSSAKFRRDLVGMSRGVIQTKSANDFKGQTIYIVQMSTLTMEIRMPPTTISMRSAEMVQRSPPLWTVATSMLSPETSSHMSATFPLAPTTVLPASGKTLIVGLLPTVAGIMPAMTRSLIVIFATATK